MQPPEMRGGKTEFQAQIDSVFRRRSSCPMNFHPMKLKILREARVNVWARIHWLAPKSVRDDESFAGIRARLRRFPTN
jgi:hypothetical protein